MYDEIKSINQVKEMEIENVVEFHNFYQDLINKKEYTKIDFKNKFGFTMNEVYKIVFSSGNYTTKKGLLIKGTPRRKTNKKIEKPILTDREILYLKDLINKGIKDYRDPEIQELIARGEKKPETIYLNETTKTKLKSFYKTRKLSYSS